MGHHGVGFERGLDPAGVAQAAARLGAAGVGAGGIVGWLGLNSLAMVEMLAACHQLGAVLLPLNWRLAAPELAHIVTHASVGVLFTAPELADLGAQVERLAARRPGASKSAAGVEPGDLLLVYTSGTTGEPKGAMHTARGMQANINAAVAAQGFDADTRVLATLPLFHVGGLCIQTLPALAVGAALCVHPRFEPVAWFDEVEAWRPTTTLLVPATMRALVQHPRWAAADLASLRFVNSGSSVVPLALIEAFHARGVPVAQVYGATETGPVSIALTPAEALAHAGSVGRAAPGVDVRLVDVGGADVAVGEVGEIWVRGANVMRGYRGAPEDPAFQHGWFHSGDLARVDAQGFYEVVGRCKDLIVSGGENIYPAEIENLVHGLPGVADCAVVGLPDARWGEVPVLAVVAQAGSSAEPSMLRAAYEPRLARFKHPHRIVMLAALPKTALGKVQKGALRAQLLAASGAGK